jgi:Domain of unknown function (DUF1876)
LAGGIATEERDMSEIKHWTVDIEIDEHEGRTRAVARLGPQGGSRLVGVGLARLNPVDRDVPEIGDELAVARALSELAHNLLEVAAGDIEQVTHEPAHLRM